MSIEVDGIACDEHEAALYVVAFERALMDDAAFRASVDICTAGTDGPNERYTAGRLASSASDRAQYVVRAWRIAKRMRGER